MPELPEVETIRRQLEPELVGRRIESIEVLDERFARPRAPEQLEGAIRGARIESVDRRGKYLLVGVEGGRTLVMHLRMTGSLRIEPAAPEPPHLRAVINLDEGDPLIFTDARRFGHGETVPTAELDAWFAGRLGVEPLSAEFTPELLGRLAAGRTAPLKSFLLAQKGVAGIGNIYADEALHRARLHPLSPAGSMRPEHCEALRDGIVAALEAGAHRRGGARATRARAAARRSSGPSSPAARPTSARPVR